ncbi:histidine kinase-, DNA gyrase B-, and HSP90-like ATPase family protein [Tanacetum coccineum]
MAYASWALKVFLKSSLNWLRVSSVGLASPLPLKTTLYDTVLEYSSSISRRNEYYGSEVDVGYMEHPVVKSSPDGEMKLRKFLEKLGVTDFFKIVKKAYEKHENVRKYMTLDYDSQELKRLLSHVSLNDDREKDSDGVNNVRLANYIGLKSTATLDDALSVLELWRKSENFKASISEMSKFYTYIWNEMSISKQKIVGYLHSQAFIFVPYSFGSKLEKVSGLFLSPNEVYWHDSTGLMKQTKSTVAHSPFSKMLCNIYPDFIFAISDQLGVHLFQKWSDGIDSGVLRSDDIDYLKKSMEEKEMTILPTVQDKWVSLHQSFGLVVTREAIYDGLSDSSCKTSLEKLNCLKIVLVEKLFYRNVLKIFGMQPFNLILSLFIWNISFSSCWNSGIDLAEFLDLITTIKESGFTEKQLESHVTKCPKMNPVDVTKDSIESNGERIIEQSPVSTTPSVILEEDEALKDQSGSRIWVGSSFLGYGEEFGRALHRLSVDLYSQDSHFLFELQIKGISGSEHNSGEEERLNRPYNRQLTTTEKKQEEEDPKVSRETRLSQIYSFHKGKEKGKEKGSPGFNNPPDMTKESGDSSKKEVSTISTTQFQCPMLKPSNYSLWAIRMQIILEANGLWEMIEPLETTQSDNKKDKTAIAFLYQALPEEQLLQITKHKTAKAIWDALKTRHIGEESVKQARLQHSNRTLRCYTEGRRDIRLLHRETINLIVASIEQYSDLDEMSVDEAI